MRPRLLPGLVAAALFLALAIPAAASNALVWHRTYNGMPGGADEAVAVAASSANTVLVSGNSRSASSTDIRTFAYGGSNGSVLWSARYASATANAVAFNPNGAKAFVAGQTASGAHGTDLLVLAYNATTGSRLWTAKYDGPGHGNDSGTALATSPDGNTVYVTGASVGTGSNDYVTIAYDASTGSQLWVARYDGPAQLYDAPEGIAATSDGAAVVVTGISTGNGSGTDVATVAYNASTGAQLWVARKTSAGANQEYGYRVVSSPDGSSVYVAGNLYGGASQDSNFLTVAYNASTGAQAWAKTFNGSAGSSDGADGIAVTPDGTKLVVTGSSNGVSSRTDFVTLGYNASTGATLWTARYNGPGNYFDDPVGVAVSADGSKAYVTGRSSGTAGYDIQTFAYATSNGNVDWSARYDNASHTNDFPYGIAVGNGDVYAAGFTHPGSDDDYLTLAYPG